MIDTVTSYVARRGVRSTHTVVIRQDDWRDSRGCTPPADVADLAKWAREFAITTWGAAKDPTSTIEIIASR